MSMGIENLLGPNDQDEGSEEVRVVPVAGRWRSPAIDHTTQLAIAPPAEQPTREPCRSGPPWNQVSRVEPRQQIVLPIGREDHMALRAIEKLVPEIQRVAVDQLCAECMRVPGMVVAPARAPQAAQHEAFLSHETIDVGE